jgi:multiple sugar transport system permease protein
MEGSKRMQARLSRSGGQRWKPSRLLTHLFVLALALCMIYPLVWMISSSFKPQDSIFGNNGLFSSVWTLDNYIDGWNALEYPFSTYMLNSLTICAGAIIGNILSCSLAAYAFARLRFRFKPLWFALLQGTILLPHNVLIVPQYILFNNLGWVNSYLPMIVPKFLATDAFFVFLLTQFMRNIPTELDDAARIDGCGYFGFYWRMVLPLSIPALATTAIFTFIWTWGDFFTQLIYLNDQELYTVPIALRTFLDNTGASAYGQLFSMSLVSLLPVFIFFLIFQKLLIEGVATTGLKG